MDELLRLFQDVDNTTIIFSITDIFLVIGLSFVLSTIIGYTYRLTYRGTSYTQSYVHTLIIMSMVVGLIMLIIGSNIARAFSLVGALSIVRFRNAVKDSQDVGYVFFAMAIGMACGTQFYILAIIATLLICLILYLMFRFDMFSSDTREQLLKIRIPADMRHGELFANLFQDYLSSYNLIAMETVQGGMLNELVYTVIFKQVDQSENFVEALRQLNQNNKIVLITGYHEVNL